MIKIIALAGALALSTSCAFAQTSQGGSSAGSSAITASPSGTMSRDGVHSSGTTGAASSGGGSGMTSTGGENGNPNGRQKTTTGPAGDASKAETTPK